MKTQVKIFIICIVALLLMIFGVFFFNFISKKDKNPIMEDTTVTDYNNVPIIDAKLGDDIKITQSYLKNYILKKENIWYQSEGVISSIKKQEENSIIQIKDGEKTLSTVIDSRKVTVKVGDFVHFVGTIHLQDTYLNLSKISLEEINYASSTKITLSDLVTHINTVKENYFIVSGYLVTVGSNYRLFDSKSSYEENDKAGNYFAIEWEDTFNYTGKQNVQLRCLIHTSQSLKSCSLIK